MEQPDILKTAVAVSTADLLAETFPDENQVIGAGLMNQGSILVVGGPPKTYKSFLINSLAYHLATGTPVFNATRSPRGGDMVPALPITRSCKVLLLEQEIGKRDLQQRLKTLVSSLSTAEATLCKERIYSYSCDHNMRLDDPMGRNYIARIIEPLKPDVIFFDPLIEFHAADENSARDMASVMHGIDWLRERFSFSTGIVHHISKPSKDSNREGPNQLRGSSVVFGKGDSFMLLKPLPKDGEGMIHINFTLRRGKPIDGMTVCINFESLLTRFMHWDRSKKVTRGEVVEMRA